MPLSFPKFTSWSDALSVRQKGLLLVSIPLAFQLLFTLAVGYLYTEAERSATREAQARIFAIRINSLVKDIWDEGELLVIYNNSQSEAALTKFAEKKAAIIEELDSLKKMSVGRYDPKGVYVKLLEVSNRGIAMMESTMERLKTAGASSVDVFTELRPYLGTVSKELELATAHEFTHQSNALLSSEQNRKIIAQLLYFGVIVDVGIALAMSAFFASSIARRLFVIADNTVRVKEKKALNPTLQGTDEIAQLDRQFHSLISALRESENLRSEFLAMTSHDLKTPLMSVDLSLELMERNTDAGTSPVLTSELQLAKENMQRVLSLINDLLDLERGASGKLRLELEDLDIQGVLKRACQAVQRLADRKGIVLKVETESFELLADRRRVEQVLVNLIGNALKFSPENSTVLISAVDAGKQVEIRVRDSGIGIDETEREKIFERFEQSEKSSAPSTGRDNGSGLGLAICKTIVEAHGGQIGVTANADNGSQFWFRIAKAE